MAQVDQKLTLEEELFCTRYELDILSGIINFNMLERWVPGYCAPQTHKEHVCRYDWVKEFVKDKAVLDIACGTGYGSYKMAEEGGAKKVMACDIDERTVKYASIRNRHRNILFQVNNAERLTFENEFDVVISFETIEHLNEPETFLKNVNKALTPDGTFFVSTPISALIEDTTPANKYHKVEWGFKRFREVVAKHLNVNDIYLQLYSVPLKPSTKMGARILRKTGLAKQDISGMIEKLEPHRWSPEELAEELIGHEWAGYQILQCKKK